MPGRLRRRWTDAALQRKGVVVLAGPMVALFVASLSLVAVNFSSRSERAQLGRSDTARAQLGNVLKLTLGAEGGMRGYLLSASPSYLASATTSVDGLQGALSSLGSDLGTAQAVTARFSQLGVLVNADLRTLAVLRSSPPGAPRSAIEAKLAAEDLATRRVQSEVAALESIVDSQVAATEAAIARANDVGFVVAALALALGLTYGLFASRLFASGIASRVRALQVNADHLARGEPLQEMPFAADEVGLLSEALTRASALLAASDVALKAEHDFLEHLVSASPVVKFEGRSAFPGFGYVSPNLERVFGIPASGIASGAVAWLDRVHPEDRSRVAAEAKAAVRERSAKVESVYRLLDGEGSQRWVHSTTRLDYGEAGVVAGLGVLLDVTESREAVRALGDREEMLRAIFDTSPDAIVVVDREGSIALASDVFSSLTGWPVDEVRRRSFFDLLDPPAVRPVRAHITDALSGRLDDFFERMKLRQSDGTERVVEGHGMPLGVPGEGGALVLVLRDITEQTVLEEKLFDASQAARNASQAKSEFLSRMSHELRTPLNAILGFAQLLDMDELPGDQEQSVRQILRGGHHLLDLINEVLDISRIEAGRLTLSLETVEVVEVVNEVVELLAPLAGEREIDVAVSATLAEVVVQADRQRLRQVIMNLVSNAIKYNTFGGSVEITCLAVGESVDLAVSDTGPGIPPDQAELVFAPFERLGAAATEVEGTGIGLTLSRHLTEVMGGSLRLSTAEVGSMFVVSLPGTGALPSPGPPARSGDAAATPRVPRLRRSASPAGSGPVTRPGASYVPPSPEAAPVAPDDEGGPAPAPPEGELEDQSEGQLEVLYVEDNLSNVRLLETTFGRMPHVRLVVVTTGRAALEQARASRPDLVLLDLHLPDIGGEEVLRRLRARPETKGVPVVVLSADATEIQVRRLRAAGADDYLTKPVDLERLVKAMERALEARTVVEV